MTQPGDDLRMCGIPREMMLEIERDRELQELREDLAFWEGDVDPDDTDSVRSLERMRLRISELEEAQRRGSAPDAGES